VTSELARLARTTAWAMRLGAAAGCGLLAWGIAAGVPAAVGLGAALLGAWVLGAVWAGWTLAAVVLHASLDAIKEKP